MKLIIVMLIWAGGFHGGPATISGFETRDACERARPSIETEYHAMTVDKTNIATACRELVAN